MMKVLAVCLGNICRSPLAEGILKDLLAHEGIDALVDSAGTSGWHSGSHPDRRSVEVARAHGIDIAGQRSRQVSPTDFDDYDIILAMDHQNTAQLNRLATSEAAREKIQLLLVHHSQTQEVPDPYYSGGFEQVYGLIKEGCQLWIEEWKNQGFLEKKISL